MNEKELDRIFNKYERTYGPAPQPVAVHDLDIAPVLQEYMRRGERIPDDYDWWAGVPPWADAEHTCAGYGAYEDKT